MKSYSDIHVGDKETLTHIISKEDLEKFVELTGDDNKLHVDEEFASHTSFKKPVVHGMLGASFISTIIGTKIPGDGALWFSQTLEFLLPVRIGDKLTITAEVVNKFDRDNIIELKTEIFNQNRQVVTRGIARVRVIEQEPATSPAVPSETKKNMTALVLGGTGGIGSATCLQLARDGFNVIIHYHRNKQRAQEIKQEIEQINQKAVILDADVFSQDELTKLVSAGIRAFGKIDVIVNCAATTIPNIRIQDLAWDDFSKQLELNIKSTLTILKEVLEGMTSRGYGKIIVIGSYSADKPNNDWAHYITAKSALAGFVKAIAFELAPKGVRFNMVTPSLVDTELTADIPQKIKLLTAAQTPLRRLANAADVAGAISFLASDKSDFITGENIRVNGGQIMI